MHRTLAGGSILALALVLPAGISSPAGSASRSVAKISLLDRAATPADALPAPVARLVDAKEVDGATVRLGATTLSAQFFVAQGTRGICLIRVDDPVAPVFTTTCASTLISGGVFLASIDRAQKTMQVADVVPDDVTSAIVGGSTTPVRGNLLVTSEIPLGSSISVVGASGAQPVPLGTSALPGTTP